MDQGFSSKKAGIINQELGWEIIAAINDDIILLKNFQGIFGGEAFLIFIDGDIRVQCLQFFFS